jgi:cell wall-associated NlpC family hydrolase
VGVWIDRCRIAAVLLSCLLASPRLWAGDATPAPTPEPPQDTPAEIGLRAVQAASLLVDVAHYRLGSSSRHAVDCSGLVKLSYESAGVPMPRTTKALLHVGPTVPPASVRPGDLLFYRFRPSGRLHVAIYAGAGRAIHASPRHNRVREIDIHESRWQKHLVTIIRPALERQVADPG